MEMMKEEKIQVTVFLVLNLRKLFDLQKNMCTCIIFI